MSQSFPGEPIRFPQSKNCSRITGSIKKGKKFRGEPGGTLGIGNSVFLILSKGVVPGNNLCGVKSCPSFTCFGCHRRCSFCVYMSERVCACVCASERERESSVMIAPIAEKSSLKLGVPMKLVEVCEILRALNCPGTYTMHSFTRHQGTKAVNIIKGRKCVVTHHRVFWF